MDCTSEVGYSTGAKSEGWCHPTAKKDDNLVSQVREEIKRSPESTLSRRWLVPPPPTRVREESMHKL